MIGAPQTRFSGRFTAILFLLFASGCGYHMRGSERPFFKSHDINTLFVKPVQNNSYKSGIEITVYNALRKRFSQGGYVRLVDSAEQADASIVATVMEASYVPSGYTSASSLPYAGTNPGPSAVQLASSYQVTLKVQFQLSDQKKAQSLWSDVVVRSKSFAASTYLGTLGTTTALINEGEFERTLNDLSVGIATDAEESINTIF